MYSQALSGITCVVLACRTSRTAAWGVAAAENVAGRCDSRLRRSTGGCWSSSSSSRSRSRLCSASSRALASEAWRCCTSPAQLRLPSSRCAKTAVPPLPPPPVTITTASTEAPWLGSANLRTRTGQAHVIALASMVSSHPCSRSRLSRRKANPVRAFALQPGFQEQVCHPRGPPSGLRVPSCWVGGLGVSGVGHVGRRRTVISRAPERIGGGVGGSISTISSSSSGGGNGGRGGDGGGGGGSRDSGDCGVKVTENIMVRKGQKLAAPAGAVADSVAADAAAEASEVRLEDVSEPAVKSATKRRKMVPSSPGGKRKGAESVGPKTEDVPGEKEGEDEASAEAWFQEKQKPKEPAKMQNPTNPSKGRGRAKPSAAKVESGEEGEGETLPDAVEAKRAGKASPGRARHSSAVQQAAVATEAEEKEGGCKEGEPVSPVKGKRSSGKASARGGGSSAKQLLAAAKEAEAEAGRSKEPWSVLVHRKRQPGWVAYDPRTMRPDLMQLFEPSVAGAAAAAAAAADASPSAAGEAAAEVGAEATSASTAALPADASAAAGGAAAREGSEALEMQGRKIWRLLSWNVNGLRALLKAKESGGSDTNGTLKAKKRKQGKGTEDGEEGVEEEEEEKGGGTSGSKGEEGGKGCEDKGAKGKVSKEAAEEAHVLAALMARENADVLCLQETKLQEKDCEELEASLKEGGFASHCVWSCSHAKLGYSGTAIISPHKPLSVRCGFGDDRHDGEGRVITAEFPAFYLVNAYVPNSGDQLKRLEYRTKDWDPALAHHIKELEKKKPVILTGDLNCAHEEIDIFHPDGNKRSAGFTVEERESFERCFLQHPDGPLIDTFRAQHPHAVAYTYWGYRSRARPENRGWRLDYFLASQSLKPHLLDSYTLPHVGGSDHCPLGLILTEP